MTTSAVMFPYLILIKFLFLNSLTLKSQLCAKLWLSICMTQEDIARAQLNIGRVWVLPRL